ncbi:MAG: hypothetical protein ACRDSJ_19500 [Rubrobacteraceae bacterium]
MEPLNLFDYERLARKRSHPAVWEFSSDGAGDGVTLRSNRAAFELENAMVQAGVSDVESAGLDAIWGG